MAEIWDICDQFTCQICFKQYTVAIMPLMICTNAHLICNQCLKNMKDSNRMPHLYCPFCRTRIQSKFVLQYKKILLVKEAASRILQRQKKEEKILRMIKQSSGYSNNFSLNVQRLYSDLVRLDKKWEYVVDQHRSCQVETAITWKKNFENERQISRLREQLSNLGELNRALAKQVEQSKFLAQRNVLLATQMKYLKERVDRNTPKAIKEQEMSYDSIKSNRLPKLQICTGPFDMPFLKKSSSQCLLKRFQKENNPNFDNFSQTIEKKDKLRPKYQTLRYKTKSQYPPKMPKSKIEIS